MPGPLTRPAGRDAWLFAFAAACVLARVQPGKPLWIDEVLHFVLGAYGSVSEAWDVIRGSIGFTNHNQTGAYMFADYFLLRLFGASPFWLRFPSLVAGLILYGGALQLFAVWGLPRHWRFLGCLALFASEGVMSFVSEARPYLPLAAAAVATLAWYSTEPKDRKGFHVRFLGAAGVIGGALVHPYYPVYGVAACVLGYADRLAMGRIQVGRKAIAAHASPWLAAAGALCWIGLGAATWMVNRRVFDLDPLHWFRADGIVGPRFAMSWVAAHFSFLVVPKASWLAWFAAAGLIILGWGAVRDKRREAVGPALLLVGGLALSALTIWLSWRARYWIAPRQWIASEAFVTLACVRLAFVLTPRRPARLDYLPAILVAVCVGWNAWTAGRVAVREYREAAIVFSYPVPARPARPAPDLASATNEEWVALANLNCTAGGSVWPVFRRFYGEPDGCCVHR